MKRKLISLFLGSVMLLGSVAVLASCADGKGKTTTGGGSSLNPDEHFLAKLPADLNFANMGYDEDQLTLNVAYTEGRNGEFTRRSLKADELDESDVDIATMARDTRMKEQLGLELEISPVGADIGDMESTIGTTLQSGTPDWDILAGYQYYGIGMAKKGYVLNLAELDAEDIQADYIDLDAPYWGKAFNENMSYKGAYYWITGDLALRYIGGMYCTYINSRLYSDMLSSEYGSIYDIAKEGKWTLDLLTTMASKCYLDNGTTPGEVDSGDTFGYGWEALDPMDGIAIGAGVQFTYRDPNTGDISISVLNQHTFDVSSKMYNLSKTGEYSYEFAGADSANIMQAFASGTVAFTVNKLFQAETYLAEMVDDYYIIPAPKYDENQANYITSIHDGCTIFGIPYCSEKVPQAAAALEFLCAYSSKDVMPLYYEGALKGRYTRDKEAATMIDLIHDSVTTDFAVAWGNSIGGLGQIFRPCNALTMNNLKRKVNEWDADLKALTDELAEYVHGGTVIE